MRWTKFILPVLYSISMVIFAAQASGAHSIETDAKKKKKKPPNTVEICGTMPGPGWITVSVDGICGRQGNRQLIGRTIIQYDELPSGASLSICGDPVPAQWVSTEVDNAPCAQIGNTFYIKRTIVRIDGMEPGTSIKTCGAQQTPGGWVPTSVSSKPCATFLNSSFIARTLTKIEGLPPDSVVKTCGLAAMPLGWLPTKVDGPHCGSFQGTHYIGKTIRNIEDLPAGTTVKTCSGMPPNGWITSAVSNSHCGRHGSTWYIERKVTKIDGLPSGATARMCGGNVPSQWIATAIPGYCATLGNTYFIEHFIKRIEGLPVGIVLDQCGGTTPWGWSVKKAKGYCANFGSFAYLGRTIVKTSNGSSVRTTALDFDGDAKADLFTGRPGMSSWNHSSDDSTHAEFFDGDGIAVPGDFDGDSRMDVAFVREEANALTFFIYSSADGSMRTESIGAPGDIPLAADWDGDGRAEPTAFRRATIEEPNSIYLYRSSDSHELQSIVLASDTFDDVPVPHDYDGDLRAEAAVYRPWTGTWLIGDEPITFAVAGGIPVPADYDHDGQLDPAVFKGGTWWIYGSAVGLRRIEFGSADDVPVPADYDGDQRADLAVYRQGIWQIFQSSDGEVRERTFGLPDDQPVTTERRGGTQ